MTRHLIKLVAGDTVRYYQGSATGDKISPEFTDGYIYTDIDELNDAVVHLNTIKHRFGFEIVVLVEVMLENKHRDWVDRECFNTIAKLVDI